MDQQDEAAYFKARAAQERELSLAVDNVAAAAVHLDLAGRYERLAERAAPRPTLLIASVDGEERSPRG